MAVATNISKALMDITGEPRPDIAILEIITDAVEHRIEKVEAGIKTYEKKYGMTFEKFKDRFEKGETANIYKYNAETNKYSFALISGNERIFGADNLRFWHIHPFEDPESHIETAPVSLLDFLDMLTSSKEEWFPL